MDSLDILLIVRGFIIHPSDYFSLRSCCRKTLQLPEVYSISVPGLVRYCFESHFPLDAVKCRKLQLFNSRDKSSMELKRHNMEILFQNIKRECGVSLFAKLLELKATDSFILFDTAIKYDREDVAKECLPYFPFNDQLRVWRRLRAAVIRGYLDIVRILIHHGVPARTLEADADPLLHTAIAHDQVEVVRYLCSLGADLQETDSDGLSAFLLACKEHRTKIVLELVELEPQLINQRDNEGRSGLILAMLNTTSHCDCAMIDCLISRGTDFATVVMPNGMLLIQYACALNRVDIVKLLVNCGVSVKQTDWQGRSCLDVTNMTFPIVSFLLEQGVPLNPSVDYIGKAAAHNELESCILLHKYKIPVKHPESLLAAVSTTCDNADCVRFLISLGIDVNMHSFSGESALYRAVVYRNKSACQLLLDAGANPTTDFKGTTLIQLAKREGFQEIVELLYDYGATNYDTSRAFLNSS